MDDWALLRDFAQHGSQPAFAALVGRHLNFVYSSARRQVRSSQLAEEVSQTVFLELARQAARLQPGTPLTSWLYLVTRRAALNALRTELRRQAREQAAYELSTMNPVPSVWKKLEPLLDEALDTLHPHDRSALLLRYFENKPLRDVGAALGASEDAAQKRVTRALEHLRRFFTRQGVAVSAAGLATQLSVHAVEAAPAALGTLISTATGSLAVATPALAVETTRALAMTTLQKTLLAGALVVIGASVYEIRALASERDQLTALEREVAGLTARELSVRQKRDTAQSRIVTTKAEVARLGAHVPAFATGDPAIAELVSRANRLKESFTANAGLKIPEMALLKDGDWLDVARERALDSDTDLRASLARVRSLAKSKITMPMIRAVSSYVAANEGRMPANGRDLQSFVVPTEPIEPAALGTMLARYEFPSQGPVTAVPDKAVLILEREAALIDRDYDAQIRISRSVSDRDTDPYKINTVSNAKAGPLAPPPRMYLR